MVEPSVTFGQSRTRWVGVALIGWAFVSLFAYGMFFSGFAGQPSLPEYAFAGFGLLFFLAVALVGTYVAFRPGRIEIRPDGLHEIVLFRRRVDPWSDVDVFHAVTVAGRQLVVFEHRVDGQSVSNINTRLGFPSASLSDSYGQNAELLALRLQHARDRYAGD